MKVYRIKKSNIDKNGRGLYAAKDIKEGTKIIDYVGKNLKRNLLKNKSQIQNHNQKKSLFHHWMI